MPYLRCDDCGAKALPIATRCPACEAPFEARGPGTSPSRLRACHACDSLVPREAERCRWCNEELGSRLSPRARAGIAAGLAALVVGGWAFLDTRAPDVVTLSAPVVESPVTASLSDPPAPLATPRARLADPSTSEAAPASVPRPEPSPPASVASAAPPTVVPSTPRGTGAAEAGSAPVRPDEGGWVQAVARTFVNVRSAPGSDSEVQGVVPENAVVFLGDARGAWRQVRAGSVAGWAWEPLFRLGSEGP
jgi:hypothetical protein